MITLALDAATYSATIAVFRGEQTVAEAETAMRGADREALLPAIADALGAARVAVGEVGRIVCGAGPGSFTSLRIAGSIAKGLAYGLRLPIHSVSSLALVVGGASIQPGTYLACLDALRGQTYIAGYILEKRGLREVLPLRLARNEDVTALAESIGGTPIGPQQTLDASPHARGALRVAALTEATADVASWEPVYGREAEAQTKWEAIHGRPLPRG